MSNNFSLDISKFVEKAKGRIDLVVQKVTLNVFSDVIRMSPVDTGRFRGNWIADIGSFPTTTVNNLDKSGEGAISSAASIVSKARSGGVVYLVNNLPYSQRLEYGYSKQAPVGMVRVAITNYQNYVNNAVSNIN